MKNQAHPMLVTIAAILVLAVSIVYFIQRTVNASPYQIMVSPGPVYHPPS